MPSTSTHSTQVCDSIAADAEARQETGIPQHGEDARTGEGLEREVEQAEHGVSERTQFRRGVVSQVVDDVGAATGRKQTGSPAGSARMSVTSTAMSVCFRLGSRLEVGDDAVVDRLQLRVMPGQARTWRLASAGGGGASDSAVVRSC